MQRQARKEFGIMKNHPIHVAYLELLRQQSVSLS